MDMDSSHEWIVLATTPPASPEDVDRLAGALANAEIEIQVEENAVRLCKNDVAVWLRVRQRDFSRATNLAHNIVTA
ncbi:MAG: hypothetical protein M1482_17955 [Chloroflexi bacterium]|nr:hypothetical protein [Chloroflexota bacterium]